MIGLEHPAFIVAEIGYNFNSIEEAKDSIDAAIECGADAVKFQTFKADTITTKDIYFPKEAGGSSEYEEFKRYELSEEAHEEIFSYGRKQGIIVFSTPSYRDDVDLLERLDTKLYKIGSDDLTNLPFLRYVSSKGKPIILSTGMANLQEVGETLEAIYGIGNRQVIVLHCVSNYPIKDTSLVNLRAIQTIADAYKVLVGFSDHTTSFVIPAVAIALGACVYERHFTISKNIGAPDAFFSADPGEFRQIVQNIRETEKALGSGIKVPAVTETNMRKDTRKSIIAGKNIRKGQVLTEKNLIIKRPGRGIEPRFWNIVLGRVAKVNIKKDECITWEMV